MKQNQGDERRWDGAFLRVVLQVVLKVKLFGGEVRDWDQRNEY